MAVRARVEGFAGTMKFRDGRFVNEGALPYTIDAQPLRAQRVAVVDLYKALGGGWMPGTTPPQ